MSRALAYTGVSTMADDSANDNYSQPVSPAPDGHGHAAMLLVESLIHSLVAQSVLSLSEAIEVVSTAIEVNEAMDTDPAVPGLLPNGSSTLLQAIRSSLSLDVPRHSPE